MTFGFGISLKGLFHVAKVIFTRRTSDCVTSLLQCLPNDLAQQLFLAHKALHMSVCLPHPFCPLGFAPQLYLHRMHIIPGLQHLKPCPVHLFLLFTPGRSFLTHLSRFSSNIPLLWSPAWLLCLLSLTLRTDHPISCSVFSIVFHLLWWLQISLPPLYFCSLLGDCTFPKGSGFCLPTAFHKEGVIKLVERMHVLGQIT